MTTTQKFQHPASGDLKFDRLPKWAQNRIEQLESSVGYWQKKANVGPENSDTFIQSHVSEDKPLGRGETILFTLPTGLLGNHHKIEVTNQGTRVQVRVGGDESIIVRPVVSNVVTITAEERF